MKQIGWYRRYFVAHTCVHIEVVFSRKEDGAFIRCFIRAGKDGLPPKSIQDLTEETFFGEYLTSNWGTYYDGWRLNLIEINPQESVEELCTSIQEYIIKQVASLYKMYKASKKKEKDPTYRKRVSKCFKKGWIPIKKISKENKPSIKETSK